LKTWKTFLVSSALLYCMEQHRCGNQCVDKCGIRGVVYSKEWNMSHIGHKGRT